MMVLLLLDVGEADCRLARCFDDVLTIYRDSWIHVTECLEGLASPYLDCIMNDIPKVTVAFSIDRIKEALDML